MRRLYLILGHVAFALLWPFLLLHRKTRKGQLRRFGFYPKDFLPPKRGPRIWLHGASAGDLLALRPIAQEWKRRFPDATLVMSALTDTGYAIASRMGDLVEAVTYQPWDLPGPTRRAMRAIDPDILVLEYTEIWPRLIAAAKEQGVRVVLTNGRFDQAKMAHYRTLFRLIGNPLTEIDLLLMREEEEAERALELGAPPGRIRVTGNSKFDALVPSDEVEIPGLAEALGPGPIFFAGSTHEGEESLLLDVFLRLRQAHPSLRLVLAPRYVDRAPRIAHLVQARGLRVAFRSRGGGDADVVILDTMGELYPAYRSATLVFVGGSFTRRGGQNILEPAARGKPVLFGPNMQNFRDSVQVLLGRGGIQVRDPEHLTRTALDLLDRPDRLAELGAMARSAVLAVGGASARNVEEMIRLLDLPEPSARDEEVA
ncbi:MAG TPA: glycosyltransferase N-terminal domain-containing protein [Fredinandcohnia sp.]|nr:glycosyltransferase N-terminal domain-containing protein [Fredinandcohnia sp.]